MGFSTPATAVLSRLRAVSVTTWACIGLATVFSIAVSHKGAPALRHDWAWPIEPFGFGDYLHNLVQALSGWDDSGLGAARSVVNDYPARMIVTTLQWILGPTASFIVSMWLLALGVGLAAALVAKRGGASFGAAGAAFMLFNPWTHTEIIAGHYLMILACACAGAVFAEATSSNPRRVVLVLALCGALTQLQFFCFAEIGVAIAIIRRRDVPLLTCAILLAAPTLVGLIGHADELRNTLYTVPWQDDQAVPVARAVLLQGYFAEYDPPRGGLFDWGMAVALGVALVALFTSSRRRWSAAWLSAAAVALVFSAEKAGSAAAIYHFLVVHVPASGVFRELYDVLGFLALAIVAVAGASRYRVLRGALLAAAGVFWLQWFLHPPAQHWLSAAQIPRIADLSADARTAALPAVQPLVYFGAGSGVDPDALPYRKSGRNVINTYLLSYPASTAILSYAKTCTVDELRALSVSRIVRRDAYLPMTKEPLRACAIGRLIDAPFPVMAAVPQPMAAGTIPRTGSPDVFAPAAGDGAFRPQRAPTDSIDEHADWIDLRLAYRAHPEFAQPYNGAYTVSRVSLNVPLAARTLVWVDGTLDDAADNRPLARSTGGYQWLKLGTTTAVRCTGTCIVVGGGSLQNGPDSRPPVSGTALPYTAWGPFLTTTRTPGKGCMRYNITYDRWFFALQAGSASASIPVGGTANGFCGLRPSAATLIVHVLALTQCMLALASLAACVFALRRQRTPASLRSP